MKPHAARATRLFAAIFALLAFAVTAAAQAQPPAAYNQEPTRFQIKSAVLGEERNILVRLPANYDRDGQKFPVLYMTDGDAHILHTTATVQFLARNGRMPEMIVVGITNTDRTRDLTPTHVARLPDNPNARFPTSGGADKFLKFIETELIPHVEKQYRTQPFRVLAGHSLGGLFAVHAMFSRPELFNAYIAVSPSLQWDNFVMTERAKEFFKSPDYNRTLYVSLGNEPGDIGDGFNLFRDILAKQQTANFVWQAAHMPDEDHGSVVLRSHYEGLRKVYDGWQLPRDPNTGAIAIASFKAALDHYKKLSARVNYEVLPPEQLINFMGYQHLGARQNEDALAAFKWNVEHYPRSANVYDSLAEYYERGEGKLDLALPLYAKAAAVGKETNDPNANLFQQNHDRVAGLLKQPANNAAAGNK